MKFIKKILAYLLFGLFALIITVLIIFGKRDIPLDELKSKYAQAPSAFIQIGDLNIHHRDEGNKHDSIPIILLHGTGSSLHTFDGWSEKLIGQKRVIRMDLPGYGLTGPFPDRDYSMKKYISFLSDFVNELKLNKFILAGNSFGGEIAWKFTLEHPGLVDKLILINSAGIPYPSESKPLAFKMARIPILKNLLRIITPRSVAKASIENVYADKSMVTNELIDRYYELTLRPGNRQAFIDRYNTNYDTTAHYHLEKILQETLILWGAEDKLIPDQIAYKFSEALNHDTLVILSNIGHVPMEENPDRSILPLLRFIESP